jgi:hypothetical protein
MTERLTFHTSDELFFGTRFLPAVIIKNELAYAAPTNPIRLTSNPVEAASRANKPELGDCGRGAIIALDRHRMLRASAIIQVGTDEFICRGLPNLSQFISGIHWIGEAAPETAAHGSRHHRTEIWSCEDWDERLADMRDALETNGVSELEMKPLDDLWDWGAYSYNSDNGGLVLGNDLHLLALPAFDASIPMAAAARGTSGARDPGSDDD